MWSWGGRPGAELRVWLGFNLQGSRVPKEVEFPIRAGLLYQNNPGWEGMAPWPIVRVTCIEDP